MSGLRLVSFMVKDRLGSGLAMIRADNHVGTALAQAVWLPVRIRGRVTVRFSVRGLG